MTPTQQSAEQLRLGTGLLSTLPFFPIRADGGRVSSRLRRAVLALCAALALLILTATQALAAPPITIAGLGEGPGQVAGPNGVAVDNSSGNPASGNLYVADYLRIDVFKADGTFLRAFGFGVRTGAEELQTCTTVCRQGVGLQGSELGSAPGEIRPSSVAVDPASHDVYAFDYRKFRVQEFDPEGHLVLIFGKEVDKGPHHPGDVCKAEYIAEGDTCGAGVEGVGPGAFSPTQIHPVAVDAAGNVWVGDENRIEEFSSTGVFVSEVKVPGAGKIDGLAVDASGDFYTLKPPVPGADELQFVNESPSVTTYTLSFGGDTTVPIAREESGYQAQDALIQAALEELPSIGRGNVKVTDGVHAVRFRGSLAATDVPQLTASAGVTVETAGQGKPLIPGVLSKLEGLAGAVPGKLVETLDAAGHPVALALDPAGGDLFVSDQIEPELEAGVPGTLLEFGPAGEQLESFATGQVAGHGLGNVLAFGGGAQRLYVASNGSDASNRASVSVVQAFVVPPVGPQVVEGGGLALPITKVSATLSAEVNPEGAATTYHFDYITAQKFKEDGEQFGAGTVKTLESGSLGADFSPHHKAFQAIGGLLPATAYRFRVVATNANAPLGVDGEAATFQTLPPAAIDSTSVADTTAESATLQAEINPLGDATSYHFEYITEAAYQANGESFSGPEQAALVPVPDAPIGAGSTDVSVSQHVQGLLPNTVYRYRAVVLNAVSEANGGPFPGGTFAFRTQAPGAFALPDGRRWEMVSPPDKHGALLLLRQAVGQAAIAGGAVTYLATRPTESEPQGQDVTTQVLSARGPSGWSTRDITLPHAEPVGVRIGTGEESRFFSADLSLDVIRPSGAFNPSLSPQASAQTAYLRSDFPTSDPTAFCATACYRPLLTGCPAEGEPCPSAVAEIADVPPGTKFAYTTEFRGATPDASHIVLESEVALTPGAPSARGLYEWAGGRLQLVSVLPGGQPAGNPRFGGNKRPGSAISNDGSRVIFLAEKHLYLRDNATQPQSAIVAGHCTEPGLACTVQLDAVQGGIGGGSEAPRFQVASSDGSQVFFTAGRRLTADSGANEGQPDLYRCQISEAEGEPGCHLTDLTPETGGEPATVQGAPLGVSADGEYVYFVANGVLAPGASRGNCQGESLTAALTCNLYLFHAGATTFIATLSGVEANDWIENAHQPARVSPDGRWLAFMSQRSLTGYDNRDAVSGRPVQEAYLYHAPVAGGEAKLVCASCDPTGARPHGIEWGLEGRNVPLLNIMYQWGQTTWVAAELPGWIEYELNSALYQPRYLSDSGRLFFDSRDALVPQDTNGTWDVYQYEPPGVGDCTEANRTFGRASGGCVGLISSGTSKEESAFFDASESGNDAFFLTNAQLSHGDTDTARDMYDARVGGGEVEPVKPVECAGDACQSFVAAPNDPTPGSLTFQGPGNFTAALTPANKKTTKTVKCKKPKRLSHGRCLMSKKKAKKAGHNRGAKR